MLWRVELPLALPSIITGAAARDGVDRRPGDRRRVVGYGGFGSSSSPASTTTSTGRDHDRHAAAASRLALVLDLLLLALGRLLMPWAPADGRA